MADPLELELKMGVSCHVGAENQTRQGQHSAFSTTDPSLQLKMASDGLSVRVCLHVCLRVCLCLSVFMIARVRVWVQACVGLCVCIFNISQQR